MTMRYLTFLLCVLWFSLQAQTTLDKIPQIAFDNFANSYNYTYWDDNFNTSGISNRKFTNQASSYSLNIDYTNMNINSLNIAPTTQSPSAAFAEDNATTFAAVHSGNIEYAVVQSGVPVYEKSSIPTNFNRQTSQMAEFGTWLNRRFVDCYFTDSPDFEPYFTGIEFTNWHNRFKITLHVKPNVDITNAQLQLAIDIPSIYANTYNTGNLYAFANANDEGFAVKGGITAATTSVSGKTVTINTAAQTLVATNSYEISLIFYAITENLSSTYPTVPSEETPINITTAQTLPNTTGTTTVNYSPDEGIHYLDIPRYGMGYFNCGQIDRMQNIEVALENTAATDKRVRLCFRQIPNVNVVGFNSMLRNDNGCPSGFPLQVSKNWHGGIPKLYSGSWIREYTEIIVPANTTLNIDYTRTGAKWGETYSASSHQLSIAGTGQCRGGWLEAALGSFGESITHSPDYQFGNSNGCDVRPFLVTNQAQGGTSQECGWTGNVGGIDVWVYVDDTNTRQYQSEVKTRFQRYSPNLTETSVSAYSADKKFKWDYTFYLNRSDDYNRIYYKVRVEALQDANFNRFDFFHLGGDTYNLYKARTLIYGNAVSPLNVLTPVNDGSNDYTTSALAIPGTDQWIWPGDGFNTQGIAADPGLNIDTNNGMIIRDYAGSFGGAPSNTPYFRERSSSIGFSSATGENPTSYCIVPPPTATSFAAGDYMEATIECVVLPKQAADYYGPNTNFTTTLLTRNPLAVFLREVNRHSIVASSATNTVNTSYPLTVETVGNTANVTLTGGLGYVPIVFSGMSEIVNPKLWCKHNNCWELVDQSTWGKDFWQSDYNPETGLYDLIYNVNQDVINDETATIDYYLGDTPPIECTALNDEEVAVKVFLQGPFNGTNMNVNLTSLIPLQHPYAYNIHGGAEVLTAIPANMVDWVLLKLRETSNQLEYTRAALLLNDGQVVDLDGSSPVLFSDVIPGMYTISVHHRNHLGVMTATSFLLGN